MEVLTEAVSRVPWRDRRCRRRRHAAGDRRRRGGGVGGRLSRAGRRVRLPHQLPIYLSSESFLPPPARWATSACWPSTGAGRRGRRASSSGISSWLGRPGVRRPRPVRRLQRRLHGVPPAPRLRRRVPVGEPRVHLVPAVAGRAGDAGDAAGGQPRPAASFPAVVGFDIDGPTVPQGPAGASSSTTWAARSSGSARATAAATPPWPTGATAASTSSPGWPSTPAAATCAPTAHPSRRWCRGATVPTSRETRDT